MDGLAAILACSLIHGTYLASRETFFEDLLAPSEPPAGLFVNSISSASAHCEPMSLNTGRFADRAKELERNEQNSAIPTPRFARKFSTWNPPFHAQESCPQNCMVEQPRNQVSEMHFDKFLNPATFQCWKRVSRPRYVPVHSFSTEAMLWIKEVEMIDSVDDLKTSRSTGGHRFFNSEMLDAKIESALKKIITNP